MGGWGKTGEMESAPCWYYHFPRRGKRRGKVGGFFQPPPGGGKVNGKVGGKTPKGVTSFLVPPFSPYFPSNPH